MNVVHGDCAASDAQPQVPPQIIQQIYVNLAWHLSCTLCVSCSMAANRHVALCLVLAGLISTAICILRLQQCKSDWSCCTFATTT